MNPDDDVITIDQLFGALLAPLSSRLQLLATGKSQQKQTVVAAAKLRCVTADVVSCFLRQSHVTGVIGWSSGAVDGRVLVQASTCVRQ